MLKKSLLALAAVALVAAASPATAAMPKGGTFLATGPQDAYTLSFVVQGGSKRKVSNLFFSTVGCNGGEPITVSKKMKVKGSGKYRFSGKGAFLSGGKVGVKFDGKFVTAKKAEGKLTVDDCVSKLDYTAKWVGGPSG